MYLGVLKYLLMIEGDFSRNSLKIFASKLTSLLAKLICFAFSNFFVLLFPCLMTNVMLAKIFLY